MEKLKFEINYKREVTLELIDSLIITALEGGSNYWYLLDHTKVATPENFERNSEIHYEWLDKIYQGSTIDIFDAEDPEEKVGELNNDNIKRGLKCLEDAQNKHDNIIASILQEEYDANDADTLFQYIVMGEITYG